MKKILALMACASFAASCASKSTDIAAAYVSPALYENLTCEQLALEAQTVSARAITASGAQDKKAGQDQAAMAVGLVLFWPAMFLAKGDGAQAAEVSRLKGEMQAIEDASRKKGCNITFQKPTAKAKA
ncbi:hypothetical protein [Shinella sp.]|uniref:hypothetical protein n=1 Tax=Shinella sp. TaxID=1870904 RepID=UPI0029B0ED30|nr:hypothetical protein [Shinella sp.]MDX3973301.1 hypothetical protein [Shinella sp.]